MSDWTKQLPGLRSLPAACCSTLSYLRRPSCCGPASARLHLVPGKGHAMVASEGEMRAMMAFWAETLGSRPPGEDVVEITGAPR